MFYGLQSKQYRFKKCFIQLYTEKYLLTFHHAFSINIMIRCVFHTYIIDCITILYSLYNRLAIVLNGLEYPRREREVALQLFYSN